MTTRIDRAFAAARAANRPAFVTYVMGGDPDLATSQAILNALREVAKGHTSLVIAHRLSTVVDADKIVVLDSGSVVEQGDHESLLRRGGHYADLWYTQQREQQRKAAAGYS